MKKSWEVVAELWTVYLCLVVLLVSCVDIWYAWRSLGFIPGREFYLDVWSLMMSIRSTYIFNILEIEGSLSFNFSTFSLLPLRWKNIVPSVVYGELLPEFVFLDNWKLWKIYMARVALELYSSLQCVAVIHSYYLTPLPLTPHLIWDGIPHLSIWGPHTNAFWNRILPNTMTNKPTAARSFFTD